MALHVDLIENRWSGAYQERVGKVFVSDGHVEVEPESRYRDLLLSNYGDERISKPKQFLNELAERYHNDYFFASGPHDEATCPFSHGERVPFAQAPAIHAAATA